jgi:hypothetical protein
MNGDSETNDIFRVQDPRLRWVRCTKLRWIYHILTGHPEMDGREEDIRLTVQTPEFNIIYRSHQYEQCDVYYRQVRVGKRRLYLKVVVRFASPDADGELLTAHLASNRPAGEVMIWPT